MQGRSWRRLLAALLAMPLLMLAASAYSAPKTLLVLGDSLSAEYGLTRGSGWVALLDKRLQQEKIVTAIVNASISGETTIGGKTRLPALLSKHAPDIVIIELGANDALRGLQLSATQSNLQALIDMSKQAKAKVLLVGMQIPPNYGADYAGKFAQLFPAAARQNKTALVPFFMKDIADKPAMFQADRMHPNEQAQSNLLDNVWPYLKPLLK
ncbi:lysophospholipase L1-like esterase [Herbaspirillum sp. CF444]|uniref:arylesterase n=1 Tax=Herbaspirillum sp. CF444 TaxID=1144319 RepID=UPI0002727DF9|nr:lysophospholipase L1-like esterase [Herbaspirillum sp. CF444]